MKNKSKISIPHERIAKFCEKWRIIEFALFGSTASDEFSEKSDVDVLVTFSPEAHIGLFDFIRMQNELKRIFKRKVDLVSRRGIENSRNTIRKKAILDSIEVIYAA